MNETIDEKLEEAILEAFDELHVKKSEQNLEAVKELVKLELESRRVNNDYYCRATEIDNETQKIDMDRQQEVEDHKVLNRLKNAVPDLVKSAVTGVFTLGMMIIAKRYEEKGFLVKIPEIVKVVMSKLWTK